MAIFYEHIKGTSDGTNRSFIKWGIGRPEVKYKTTNGASDEVNYGKIVTTNGGSDAEETQTITTNLATTKTLTINGVQLQGSSGSSRLLSITNAGLFVDKDITCEGRLEVQGDSITLSGATSVQQLTVTNKLQANGNVEVSGYVEANYFNATSDARAKKNITPAQFSALSVVKEVPIYTFNYINQPDEKSIGVIAQEVEKYNLDDFNITTAATSSDDGLLRVKESKLVYILWKAVQELSAKVEELEARLK